MGAQRLTWGTGMVSLMGAAQLRAERYARALRGQQDMAPVRTPWGRSVILGVGTGLAAGMTLTAAASAVAGYFARVVVTPVKERVEDLEILAVVRGRDGDDVILPATDETVIDGVYGLYFHGGQSFARIGHITSFNPREGTLSRRIEAVHGGALHQAVRGWWSSVTHLNPADAHFESEDVTLNLPGGAAPAWYVPPAEQAQCPRGRNVWAVMVHGRGGRRTEGIKALPVTHGLGLHSLLMSYRNDGEAPAAADGKYGLGVTEWEDVEVGIQYALDHGADEVVLFGWSMGGAICLQTVDRSPLAASVSAMVLTGPVIDWIDVLAYQARALRIPEPVGRLTRWMISNRAARRITGLASPVDLKVLNWIDRADQLVTPTLILHSSHDHVVPYGPSRDLAQKNALVSYVPFQRARHVKEWNYDPERWERKTRQWLEEQLNRSEPGAEPPAESARESNSVE